jgi:D-beta-D-heptose 7-phosphate kinase/D-beta-D-heptose 1-phosphate adenosyltransferase
MFEQFNSILSWKKKPKILVVGDLILDEYLSGAMGRISPEAPVPVLDSTRVVKALGGAANVAANLASLGCEVILCGVRGEDSGGEELEELLRSQGISTEGIVVDPSRPTTHKLRVLSKGQHVLRIDREEVLPLAPETRERLLLGVTRWVGECDGVICSDYQKGVLGAESLAAVMEAGRTSGRLVLVDPKGTDYGRYRGAHLLTPNRGEIELACGRPVDSEEELTAAVTELFLQTEAAFILATCGKDGMILYGRGGERERISAQAREVYDVTGAGDTVISVLALGILGGFQPKASARLANIAAGLVVGKLGTATLTRGEIVDFLHGRPGLGRRKLVDWESAASVRESARRLGKTVVFTNGCFDLLHAGHVQYLQRARDEGELLILGLNSDASVREVKGPGRPVVRQADRALVLAALECVDYVVLFDEETPASLISHLQPDVLVKGADYKPSEVVGRDTVLATGGRLVLVDLIEGRSTSLLVEQIMAAPLLVNG